MPGRGARHAVLYWAGGLFVLPDISSGAHLQQGCKMPHPRKIPVPPRSDLAPAAHLWNGQARNLGKASAIRDIIATPF